MNNGLYSSQGTGTADAICKVLFFNAIGSPAYYTANTSHLTLLGNTVYESAGIIKNGNSIVVNSSGYYNIYAQVYIDPDGTSDGQLAVYINGNPISSNFFTSGVDLASMNISTVLQLNGGDNIAFYINSSARYDVLQNDPTFNAQASYAQVYKI